MTQDPFEDRSEPDQGQLAPINGTEIWYHDTGGSGSPLLLVGGYTAGHFAFDFTRKYLRDYRLITWEPRGLGRSGYPFADADSYSTEVWATDLYGLLEHLEIDRTAIWAAGFGSYTAFKLAADHPAAVSALVTYTDVWAGDPGKSYDKIWPPYKAIIDSFGTKGFGARVLANIFGLWDVPWFLEWESRNVEETLHPETVRQTVGYGLLDADVREDLHRVKAPVRVLMGNGTWDGGVSDPDADQSLRLIKERVPEVDVDIVEGAHPGYVPVQEPERCATSVSEFVSRHH